MKIVKVVLALFVLASVVGMGFLYAGVYPMGADVPHNGLTYWALETLRERSIARVISGVAVPPLDDPQQLISGGADYNDMCTGCHLKPGRASSELTQGLYPQPPNLAMSPRTNAARQFWIIKHGIKASGMAAFGKTHDDARIWAIVAFLQRLPELNAGQYQVLTARAEGEHEHMHGDHSEMAPGDDSPTSPSLQENHRHEH